jgi:ribosome-associated protein
MQSIFLTKKLLAKRMERPKSGVPDFGRFKCASRLNPTCVVKPGGDVSGTAKWNHRRNRLAMIRITPSISIGEGELEEHFIRASGPGGQNVNKLASAVQLRFDVRRSPGLPDDVRARLERLAGRRLTRDGVLVIEAQRHRTQERNREDARERLFDLIRRAAVAPRARRPTKPTAAARERRLESKKRRSAIKGRRAKPPLE